MFLLFFLFKKKKGRRERTKGREGEGREKGETRDLKTKKRTEAEESKVEISLRFFFAATHETSDRKVLVLLPLIR